MDESDDESTDSFDFSDIVDVPLTWNKKSKKKNMIDGHTYDDMYFMDILVQLKSDYYRTKSNRNLYTDEFYDKTCAESSKFEHEQLRFKWLPKDIYDDLSTEEKTIMGFCCSPPRNEYERIDIKAGYEILNID